MSQNRLVGAFLEVLRTPWMPISLRNRVDYAFFSDYVQKWRNPTTGGPDVLGVGVDSFGDLTWGGQLATQPLRVPAVYAMETNAAIVDQVFYIANQKMRVISITEKHRVLGSSSTLAAVVRKCTSGQTIAQGTTLMVGSFDLHAVAETVQTATLATNPDTLTLQTGDALAFDVTGTTTALAGEIVTVMLEPLDSPTMDITFSWASNTQLTSSNAQFFIANAPYTVTAARWSHSTAGSSATCLIEMTKDATTDAPGAGTALLTNNTSTGFDGHAAANVPQVATFVTTAGALNLAIGQRLSLDFNGTLTALAGVCCTVSLTPIANRTEINFYLPSTWAANTDRSFFIADRNYTAYCASEVHAVAAGSTSTAQLTKDVSTDAVGTGVDLQLSAADLNGTAQTVVSDLLVTTLGYRNLQSTNRLSWDFAHAVQSSAGICVTVSLMGA